MRRERSQQSPARRRRRGALVRLAVAAIAGVALGVPAGGSTVAVLVGDEQAHPAPAFPDDLRIGQRYQGDVGDGSSPGTDAGRGGGGRTGISPALLADVSSPLSSRLGANGIPHVALRAYRRAESTMRVADPSCGLDWSLLAAIGRVESDHGRFGGARLRADGSTTRPIRGVPLDGGRGVATIADTDGGRMDGDRRHDRAVGPMQFIPSTWRRVASDGNGDGRSDPDNIYDAALGAAVYLCAGSTDLRERDQRAAAVRRYNHSDAYVALVLDLADAYRRGLGGNVPDVGPAPTPPALVGTPFLPPAHPGPPAGLAGGGGGSSASDPPPAGPAPTQPPASSPPRTGTPTVPTTVPPTLPIATPPALPVPTLRPVVDGILPSGPWALSVGAVSDEEAGTQVALRLDRAEGASIASLGPTSALDDSWGVTSADGGHLVWGLTPADVSTLTVTLSDGRIVSIPTVDPALSDVAARVFAAPLPQSAGITAMEGHRSDGTIALRADDLATALLPVAGFDPAVYVQVTVVEVAQPAEPSGTTGSTGITSTSSTSTASTTPIG